MGSDDNDHLDPEEDALLKRFNALRAPTDALATPPTSASFRGLVDDRARRALDENDELERIADGRGADSFDRAKEESREAGRADRELKARISKLRGGDGVGAEGGEPELSDDEVSYGTAYIASLSTSAPPNAREDLPSPPRTHDLRALDREANDALRATSHLTEAPSSGPFDEPSAEDDHPEETAEDIVARALAEASLDGVADPTHTPEEAPPGAEEPSLAFPALPTHHPELQGEDEDTKAMMSRLLGLSGPSNQPGPAKSAGGPGKPPRLPGQGWGLPGYEDARDDDMEAWCCECDAMAYIQREQS
jgi:hypothetical protein